MRVLVAGGAGQIGSRLCGLLLDSGHEVICVDNLITGTESNLEALKPNPGFSFRRHDITEPLEITGVDAIYHLASPASPNDFGPLALEILAVNSVGTANLLRLARNQNAAFLFASTSEVYGDPLVHPQGEAYWGNVNPVGPRSCYDESKRFGEALTSAWIRSEGIDARIVRIFNTYGPNTRTDDGRLVPNLIGQALRDEPMTVYGDGTQTRSLCYVDDTAEGIRRAMEWEGTRGEIFNIGSPDEHTVSEFAQEIARICGVTYRPIFRPAPVDDPTRRRPSIAKAEQVLGWSPRRSLEQGIKETVKWFRTVLPATPSRIV